MRRNMRRRMGIACRRCGRVATPGGELCLKCRQIVDAAEKAKSEKRKRFEQLVEWCQAEGIRELARKMN